MLRGLRRPDGRLFCGLLSVLLVWSGLAQGPVAWAADAGPATTRVSDLVYRADGTAATGTVLISWPAFTTSDAKPVAAGTKSVILGTDGSLVVDLVPNAGATPAGSYYQVVFQLDSVVRTEYWLVGATSPTTISAVRATPGSGTATPPVSKQYVDNAIAADRAYVDSAVASVGAGSYVAKNGDAMSGPLTLPSDPSAPNQASTKHYVDTALLAKASLVSGVVPPVQLGNGSADDTSCLKGNSTWGPCGTSSNATALQGIPLDTAAPSDGQVVTYDASAGKYKAKPGTGGATPGMLAIKYSTDFAWTQSPTTDLSTAGAKTVSLASCPAGVVATEVFYYVYIAGTGTPEAVKVMGGTCAGNGSAGTLQFTTINPHPAGYTISSATSGIQEASINAKLDILSGNSYHYFQDGYVRVPPGIHQLYAPLTFVASGQTIEFSGAIVKCNFDADCIVVGRSDSYGTTSDVTLIKPRGMPTIAHGQHSMIAVYGQKTRLFNVTAMMGPRQSPPSPENYGNFGHLVTVVADQAFLLDGLNTTTASLECTATFCGSYVYAPGPFNGHGSWGTDPSGNNAAVGWLKNMQVAPLCAGNGVDWQSGNVVHIEDSVIQGYSQFGIRVGMAGGGYGMMTLDNVYEEGGCGNNPLGNVGYAGVIVQGGRLSIHGGEMPYGYYPLFANTGSSPNYYYIVARDNSNHPSNLLIAGSANTNGTGNVTITIPDIASATSFDVLKTSAIYQAPYGTGNWAVATGVSRASACAGGVCTFTDTQAAPTSYTVATASFYPKLDLWPGALVLGPSVAGNSAAANSTLSLDFNNLNQTALWQTNTYGITADVVDSTRCILMPGSPIWQACVGNDQDLAGTLLYGKTALPNLKGRLNLMTSGGGGPSHFITLFDSNLQKTTGAANNRPTNDANDTYLGYDQSDGTAASIGLSLGAPASISEYIANVGDGTNWKERLTATQKSFTVPVSAPGYQISGSYGTNGQCLKSTGTGSAWGSCGSGGSSSPLTTKGDLWGFGTADARVAVGTDGQCLVADSTNAVGVKWGACGSGAAQDSAVVHNTGTETVGGDKTFSGNVTVQGAMTVSGAWQVESAGPATAMTAGAGDSKVGFDSDGKLKVSENGGAVTEVAKVSTNITGTAAGITGKTTPSGSLVGDTDTQTLSNKTLASPAMTGTPTAPTAAAGTSTTQVATTAFVQAADACPAWLTAPHGIGSASFTTTANKATLYGVVLYCTLTTTQVTYYVGTADNTTNSYDIGLYDSTGAVKAHIGTTPGTTFAPTASSWRTLSWTSSATLPPGKYYLAFTTNCTTACATMAADNNMSSFTFYSNSAVSVSSGGTLSSIAAPGDLPNVGTYIPAWYVH